MSNLCKRFGERFGVFPNFFRLAPETPEITEKLWRFAQAAYFDNPLPSVFKERLFVHTCRVFHADKNFNLICHYGHLAPVEFPHV